MLRRYLKKTEVGRARNAYMVALCTLFIIGCQSLPTGEQNQKAQILIVDSSFAPIGERDQLFASCYLISESSSNLPEKGECYNKDDWKRLSSMPQEMIEGYLDANARKDTASSTKWKKAKKKKLESALEAKRLLKLTTHGTRSFALAEKGAGKELIPIFVRNTSSTVGGTVAKGCSIGSWTDADIKEFSSGKLFDYQERISKILSANSGVRVVNISLGYKLAWMIEDNPKCTKQRVEKEYEALKATWRSLFKKHLDVKFVVAAGNEGEDFSKSNLKEGDLWSALSGQPNLILVGALDDTGNDKMSFSNFGLKEMAWEIGSNISIQYPTPLHKNGYPSFAHGTSSSAPLHAGKILKK